MSQSAQPPSWNPRRRNNQRSRAQEGKRAKQQGGRTQAGSGSSWRAPGDVVTPDYLEQLKFTDKESYRILLVEWKASQADAHRMGREGKWVIDFPQQRIRLVVTEEPYDG